MSEVPASRWVWLSIAAALATIVLKSVAAYVSNSVGMLSDAMESGVNLIAAVVTMLALRWSEAEADAEHPFGHSKGELLAALLEGVMVMIAGGLIVYTSVERLVNPEAVASAGLGIGLSIAATLINAAVGALLVRKGKKLRSTALEADGHHLLSDVWTSVAVVVGIVLVTLTGKPLFDALSASLVAVFVLYTGYKILKNAIAGLVDTALDAPDAARVEAALATFRSSDISFDPPRGRKAGRHFFVQLVMRVPGTWSVREAHELADNVESTVGAALTTASVDIHVEPLKPRA
jgi:cation diffusion facilitator family transporter